MSFLFLVFNTDRNEDHGITLPRSRIQKTYIKSGFFGFVSAFFFKAKRFE